MYNIVKGRLAEKPQIKERDVSGQKVRVVNTTIFIYDNSAKPDEKGLKAGTPCPIVAWEDNAEILSCKEKGDVITFVGLSKTMIRKFSVYSKTQNEDHKDLFIDEPVLGYVAVKIDDTGNWAADMDSLAKELIKGTVKSIPNL